MNVFFHSFSTTHHPLCSSMPSSPCPDSTWLYSFTWTHHIWAVTWSRASGLDSLLFLQKQKAKKIIAYNFFLRIYTLCYVYACRYIYVPINFLYLFEITCVFYFYSKHLFLSLLLTIMIILFITECWQYVNFNFSFFFLPMNLYRYIHRRNGDTTFVGDVGGKEARRQEQVPFFLVTRCHNRHRICGHLLGPHTRMYYLYFFCFLKHLLT